MTLPLFPSKFEKELLDSTHATSAQQQRVIEKVAEVHDLIGKAEKLRDTIHHVDKSVTRKKAALSASVSNPSS